MSGLNPEALHVLPDTLTVALDILFAEAETETQAGDSKPIYLADELIPALDNAAEDLEYDELLLYNSRYLAGILIRRPKPEEILLHESAGLEPTTKLYIKSAILLQMPLQEGIFFESKEFEVWVRNGKSFLANPYGKGIRLEPLLPRTEQFLIELLMLDDASDEVESEEPGQEVV